MRHGDAEFAAVGGDSQRQLTDAGRLKVQRKTQSHLEQLKSIEVILHSPYVRAVRTAQLVAERIGASTVPMIESHTWTPAGSLDGALESLEPFVDQQVLVVTHLPLVGEVAGGLLHGRGASLPFSCAGLVALELDWPATAMASLLWEDL